MASGGVDVWRIDGMRMLAVAFLLGSGAILFAAAVLWLKKTVGSASLRTGRHRHAGFSVFDLQVSVGGPADRSKREAALYLTLKSSPADPHSAAKLLFCQKVRRLSE
jgi:hypothetical protein